MDQNTLILSRNQVRRLDHLAIEQFGMTGLVLMENAGRGLADFLTSQEIRGTVVIACGKGNNAGDGFVLARHLDLRGFSARVLLWADPDELTGDAAANFQILQKTDVPIVVRPTRLEDHLDGAGWLVDALLGTGAVGQPRPPFDTVIEAFNTADLPRLAVDLPSGLDCDTGAPATPTFRADHTCTFAAAKPGFFQPEAQPFVGQLHVCDIGAPRKLLEQMASPSNADA